MNLFFSLFPFFDNFCNSSTLIVKLYESCLYGIGTAQKDRKGMLEMLVGRKVKRGDFKYLHPDTIARCKWLNRRSVTMLFSNVEWMATTSTVPHWIKDQCQKSKKLAQTLTCTISYIVYNMILNCSILEPLFQPTWFNNTQVKEDHHYMAKQVLKERISISLSKVTYHYIFQSFKYLETMWIFFERRNWPKNLC